MPGLVHYYVGIDREMGTITNVSLWDSLEHARGLDGLPGDARPTDPRRRSWA
jgi:hypothetical protein